MFWFWLWIFSLTLLYTVRRMWWLSPYECIVTHLPAAKRRGTAVEQGRILTAGLYVLYPLVESVHTIEWSSCSLSEKGVWRYGKTSSARIPLCTLQYVVSDLCYSSQDDVSLQLQLSFEYHVELSQVQSAVKHSDPVQLLVSALRQCVGEYVQSHSADELLQQWSPLAKSIASTLKKKTEREQLGLSLDHVHVLRIDYGSTPSSGGGDESSLQLRIRKWHALKKTYPQCSDVALALFVITPSLLPEEESVL